MAQIGSFIRTQSGYSGRIWTPLLDVEIVLVSLDPGDTENAPDFRVHLAADDGPEIGAGWKRTGEKAGEYVSLQIDDPAFIQPLRANLFRQGDAAYTLQWSRASKRDEKA
jgi:uncharacterized protein (DUF736 family)